MQEKGLPQRVHLVLQVLVPSHKSFHHLDSVQFAEEFHFLLELLDQLLVAAPDILLRYSVVLPFLVALLLREVADAPGACPCTLSQHSDVILGMGVQGVAVVLRDSPFPFPLAGLGGSL
jgi:hypothetical protein